MNESQAAFHAPFRKVLVPVGVLLAMWLLHWLAARAITDDASIILTGLIRVAPDQSLSTAARGRERCGRSLASWSAGTELRRRTQVRVSAPRPWDEPLVEIIRSIKPDLLVIKLGRLPSEVLGVEPRRCPCTAPL